MERFSLEMAWVGLLTYGLNHLLHILIWRLPKSFLPAFKSTGALLVWLLVLPLTVYALLFVWFPPSLLLAPMILHLVLSAHYISFYPAFQASSPSIEILNFLFQAQGGLGVEELIEKMQKGCGLVEDRMSDLQKSRLIRMEPSGYKLHPLGTLLALIFWTYRKIIGLPGGEG